MRNHSLIPFPLTLDGVIDSRITLRKRALMARGIRQHLSFKHLKTREKGIVRVFLITLFFNWLVAFIKIVIGVLTGRVTILADGLHSIFDCANNIMGMVAVTVSSQPPDPQHPYGHRKFENLAALAIGVMIFLIGWEIFKHVAWTVWMGLTAGIEATGFPDQRDFLFAGLLIFSICVNLGVARYQLVMGRKLNSPLLKADAGHTVSDSATTGLSLLSLFAGGLVWWIDPLLALGVLVFLIKAGWGIIRENLPAFTDQVQLDPEDVHSVAMGVLGVEGTFDIRSHGTTNDIHLDMGITIDGSHSASEAAELEELVRRTLQEQFPGLTLIAIHHQTPSQEVIKKSFSKQ